MAGSGIAQHSIVNSKAVHKNSTLSDKPTASCPSKAYRLSFENLCLNAKLLTYAFADYIMLSFSS